MFDFNLYEEGFTKYIFLSISLIIILLSFPQCGENSESLIIESSNIDFGYLYSIAAPAQFNVTLKSDTLYTKIALSGCEAADNFELQYSDQSDIRIIWLKNNVPTSPCDAYFEYWVKNKLPNDTPKEGKRVLFIGPSNVQLFIN